MTDASTTVEPTATLGAYWYADPQGSGPSSAAAPGRGPRRRIVRAALIGAGAAGVLAGPAIGYVYLTSEDSVTVDYTITVDKDCDDTSLGYGDLDTGTGVEVVDGSGDLLGFATLGVGTDAGVAGCEYRASFEISPAGDGIYRVTAGNENRGYLNYDDEDIVDGTLQVTASLG